MVDELIAMGVFVVVIVAEALHYRRSMRVSSLAFVGGRPAVWSYALPWLRAAACALLCWGLIVLLKSAPESSGDKELKAMKQDPSKCQHVVLILDVSPSMLIKDAGKTGAQKRSLRAVEVMESILSRVAREDVRYSLIATYTDARPVIVDSIDANVITNIMELPLEQAFDHGKTKLMKGVKAAFEIAKDWAPGSTTFLMITDGDTVDVGKGGLPRRPRSFKQFLIAGLGTRRGSFIDGHQSRQDGATLRYMASRFAGVYQDVNIRHFSTKAMGALSRKPGEDDRAGWTRKQLAIAACGIGALLLALMPVLLELFGFNFRRHIETKQELPARVQS